MTYWGSTPEACDADSLPPDLTRGDLFCRIAFLENRRRWEREVRRPGRAALLLYRKVRVGRPAVHAVSGDYVPQAPPPRNSQLFHGLFTIGCYSPNAGASRQDHAHRSQEEAHVLTRMTEQILVSLADRKSVV